MHYPLSLREISCPPLRHLDKEDLSLSFVFFRDSNHLEIMKRFSILLLPLVADELSDLSFARLRLFSPLQGRLISLFLLCRSYQQDVGIFEVLLFFDFFFFSFGPNFWMATAGRLSFPFL